MRVIFTVSAVLALSSALLAASCVQSSDESPPSELGKAQSSAGAETTAALDPESSQTQSSSGSESIGEAQQESWGPRFTPGDFIFVIEHEWDGKDEAGGWQIAFNTAGYAVRVNGTDVYTWQCKLKIGMPRHSEKAGDIATNRAAALSAEVANAVAWPMLDRQEPWTGQGEAFCSQQLQLMQDMFKSPRYKAFGARVSKP
jgi:hypothetical protein